MINLQIRQFREKIIAVTNENQLPIEIKRLVFKEIMQQLQDASDQVVKSELEQSLKKEDVLDNEQGVQHDRLDK